MKKKFYGALLGKDSEAVSYFDALMNNLTPVMNQESTGKTVAFFYITSSGAVNVRKSTDYVAKCVTIAGGDYVSFDESAEDNAQSTINIQMESFYHGAVDADVLIYNSTIEGEIRTMDELIAKCPLLAQFKAVQNGNVWCTAQSLFQQSMELPDLILDMNRVFTKGTPADSELTFLTHVE